MPRGFYPDINWFQRAVRVLPVLAGAALIGGMIGGFAVFAIDSALTWKPTIWEPTTREPNSQSRSDVRADNQSADNQSADNQSAIEQQQPTKPVRIVGGAIPDPSAGMSGPPPVQQPVQQEAQQRPANAQPRLPVQVLTPTPLGPALPLQTEAATAVAAPHAQQQPQAQTASQTANQPQSAAVTQQPTHWPDALSRAPQNAASALRQSEPPANAPNVQTGDHAANQSSEADPQGPTAARAAGTDDQGHFGASRRGRHGRRHMTITTNAPRGQDVPAQQVARSYNRIYDSYGGDRDMQSVEPRFDVQRRFARDPRYRGRSQRVQTIEAPPPRRPESFWGGGNYRRYDGPRDGRRGFQYDDE